LAHFARLDQNNIVVFVTVGRDEDNGKEAELSARTGDVYKHTPFRKNYAGLGYTYDAQRDAFIAPQPYPSWLLNEDTCLWGAPVPMPTDDKRYSWDEATTSWVQA